jgi:phosphotransferase system HPr-like phosphotransfer protein
MGVAQYEIVPVGKQWGVLHDGSVKFEYATKEAAFESAAAAASLAIKQGHEIRIRVPSAEDSGAASKAT